MNTTFCKRGHLRSPENTNKRKACRPCLKELSPRYNLATWNSRLKATYGIDVGQYNALFATQKGFCAICNKHQQDLERQLGVDHDHKTGKIRGLLCSECNSALGFFKDSRKNLENAMIYLEETYAR